jgi:hypothetical protein
MLLPERRSIARPGAATSSVLITDLEDFVRAHRTHGPLRAAAAVRGHNGYRLQVRCRCGTVLARWVTPDDGAIDMALPACWG